MCLQMFVECAEQSESAFSINMHLFIWISQTLGYADYQFSTTLWLMGVFLLRQIRLRESVFVSFLSFFTAHNSPWLPTHPVFWLVFVPNYRRAQNHNVLWMSPPHILVDRFRRTSMALSVLPALCVKKCHPFSDLVPPPPKILAVSFLHCCIVLVAIRQEFTCQEQSGGFSRALYFVTFIPGF